MPRDRVLLVDGYNVIHRVPELEASLSDGLQNARNRLAVRISAWAREHADVECVIVFDGDFQYSGGRDQRLAGIRCLFSLSSHGGDDEIIRFVRDYKGRKSDITVVSDDNKVGNNCRAHGASVRPASFIMNRKARPSTAGVKDPARAKGIDSRAAAKIDAELKKKFGL
jgi:predicted RNA-binding protein with PIN domain